MKRRRCELPIALCAPIFALVLLNLPLSLAEAQVAPALRAAAPPLQLEVDLMQSRVHWIGTKFRGRGRHEGFVRLRDATLQPCTAAQCRGHFTLDMHNLEITDIPASDPVPRRRLRDHLRSRDFFWTERYPVATFVLTGTRASDRADSVDAYGELTLRDVTRPIRFPARITYARDGEVHVRAELTIDRQQWGIRYRFDPIRNELVDDDIMLTIVLVARAHAPDADAN